MNRRPAEPRPAGGEPAGLDTRATRPAPPIVVRRAAPADLDEMVACHLAAFPGDEFPDAMPLLGPGFLRVHHGFYADAADGICLVARDPDGGRLAGFVLGGAPGLRPRFLRRFWWRLGFLVLSRAVVHGAVRARIHDGIRGLWRRRGGGSENDARPPAEPAVPWSALLFLATHPDYRGRGAGRLLADAFLVESARLGFRTVRLTTGVGNRQAIAFYRKTGWRDVGETRKLVTFERDTESHRAGAG